jgi:hypothetical protein
MKQSTLRIAIIILALTTAVVHLALGVGGIAGGRLDTFNILFVLNGLGYIGLLAALFVPNFPFFSSNRSLTHYLMIVFAAVTFVLYFVFNGIDPTGMGVAAIVAKLAELLLVIATFLHLRAK